MKYLIDYTKDLYSNLFDKCGAFFAFSTEQFESNIDRNIEYGSMGSGLFVPLKNADFFSIEYDKISQKGIILDVEENGAAAIIEREYFNYETHFAYDKEDVLNALKPYVKAYPSLFTEQVINKGFKDSWDKAVVNDWF